MADLIMNYIRQVKEQNASRPQASLFGSIPPPAPRSDAIPGFIEDYLRRQSQNAQGPTRSLTAATSPQAAVPPPADRSEDDAASFDDRFVDPASIRRLVGVWTP